MTCRRSGAARRGPGHARLARAESLPRRRGLRGASARSWSCRSSCRCWRRSRRRRRPRQSPPTYFPHELSLDAYQRLWEYQAGLPTYVLNSLAHGAALTIAVHARAHDPRRLRAGPLPGPGQGAALRLPAAGPDHPVPGAAHADLPDVRPAQADQLAGRSGHRAHRDPAAVQPVHHAQQLRGGAAGARGGGGDRRRQLVADPASRSSCPAVVPAIVTVALFAFVTSWNEFLGALVLMSTGVHVHAAADPRRRPHRDQPGRHRLGDAPGRDHDLDDPVHRDLPAAAAVLRLRAHCGAVK